MKRNPLFFKIGILFFLTFNVVACHKAASNTNDDGTDGTTDVDSDSESTAKTSAWAQLKLKQRKEKNIIEVEGKEFDVIKIAR